MCYCFFVGSLKISTYTIVLFVYTDPFTSLPIFIFVLLALFHWLGPPVQCWKQVQRQHPCLVSDFRGNTIGLFTFKCVSWRIFIRQFYWSLTFPFILLRVLIIKCRILTNFFCICWDDQVVFLLFSVYMMKYINWFSKC